MAPVASFGGAGTPGGSGFGAGTVGQTAFTSIDPSAQPGGGTYSSLLSQLQGRLPGAPPSFQDILTQGVNSPLLQTVLNPAMANLRSQFDLQNQQFQDEFRSAGALGSGAQGVGMGRLAQAQGNSMGNLISQVISQMLPQMSQGLNQQYQNQLAVPGLLGSILGTAKPQVVQGRFPTGSASSSSSSSFLDKPFTDLSGMQADFLNNPWLGGSFGGDDLSGLDLSGMGGATGGGGGGIPYPGVTTFSPTESAQPGMSIDEAFQPFTDYQYGESNTPIFAGEY